MDAIRPEKVRICHPSPDVRDAWVFPSAVPHWERAGWMTPEDFKTWQAARKAADAPPPGDPSPAGDAGSPDPSAEDADARPARKRRASKESS